VVAGDIAENRRQRPDAQLIMSRDGDVMLLRLLTR